MELTVQAMKKVDAAELYRKFVAQSVRPDGRSLEKGRKVTVTPGSIGTAAGSSLVRIGATSVLCGIIPEVAAPLVASPSLGFIVPNLDLSPLCSPRYRPGPPSDRAQIFSETLASIISRYEHTSPRLTLYQLGFVDSPSSLSLLPSLPSPPLLLLLPPTGQRWWISQISASVRERQCGCSTLTLSASMMMAMFSTLPFWHLSPL